MIELVLTLMYVGLSGLILCRWWRQRDAEAAPGVAGQRCEVNEPKDVRIGRLRCRLRFYIDRAKAKAHERGQR